MKFGQTYYVMAHKRDCLSKFERIKVFVMKKVRRHRPITVKQLRRTLSLTFGAEFFKKRQNLSILDDVMEYLLFTRRLIIVKPNKEQHLRLEARINASHNISEISKYVDIW